MLPSDTDFHFLGVTKSGVNNDFCLFLPAAFVFVRCLCASAVVNHEISLGRLPT